MEPQMTTLTDWHQCLMKSVLIMTGTVPVYCDRMR